MTEIAKSIANLVFIFIFIFIRVDLDTTIVSVSRGSRREGKEGTKMFGGRRGDVWKCCGAMRASIEGASLRSHCDRAGGREGDVKRGDVRREGAKGWKECRFAVDVAVAVAVGSKSTVKLARVQLGERREMRKRGGRRGGSLSLCRGFESLGVEFLRM